MAKPNMTPEQLAAILGPNADSAFMKMMMEGDGQASTSGLVAPTNVGAGLHNIGVYINGAAQFNARRAERQSMMGMLGKAAEINTGNANSFMADYGAGYQAPAPAMARPAAPVPEMSQPGIADPPKPAPLPGRMNLGGPMGRQSAPAMVSPVSDPSSPVPPRGVQSIPIAPADAPKPSAPAFARPIGGEVPQQGAPGAPAFASGPRMEDIQAQMAKMRSDRRFRALRPDQQQGVMQNFMMQLDVAKEARGYERQKALADEAYQRQRALADEAHQRQLNDPYRKGQLDIQRQELDFKRQSHPLDIEQKRAHTELERQKLEALKQKAEDPLDAIIRQRMQSMGGGQPSQPQGGGVQLQSAPVDGDPNLIQAQTATPGEVKPQQKQQTVEVPGLGPMPRDLAEMMALKAARDKNAPLADMINQAIGKGDDKARNDLEKNMAGQFNELGRLKLMIDDFKPENHTQGTKIAHWFNQKKAGAGLQLTPEDQADLTKFVQGRTTAINNFNMRLKEASGTAVSAQEFERVQAELPNPGTGMINGVFDGDDPVTYKAKMQRGYQMVALGMARNKYLRDRGFNGTPEEAARMVSLDSMPQVVQKRTEELQKMFSGQGVKPEQLAPMIQKQLKQEFGI